MATQELAWNLLTQEPGRDERHANAAGTPNIDDNTAPRHSCGDLAGRLRLALLRRAHGLTEAQASALAALVGNGRMIDARDLTLSQGGRWHGRYGAAPCPLCQPDRRRDQNTLTLANGGDGRLLVHCKRLGCAFADVLAAAGVTSNIHHAPDPVRLAQRDREQRADTEKRAWQAQACWQDAGPIAGTLAEAYLRQRGIDCALSPSLRFHPACWHGATSQALPAMVALVEGGDGFAVHRTYLAPEGSTAAVEPAKAMLGAVAVGAVRLTAGAEPLVVAEGIETGLSLASGLLAGPAAVWATLFTSGIRSLRLPTRADVLTIASDGDVAGRAVAHALAERAHALGWRVALLPAPDGLDWNDVLTATAAAEGAA